MIEGVASWWEALPGDPTGALLNGPAALGWRVLVELLGRPEDSMAVHRFRARANVEEPISWLLSDLAPDGTWNLEPATWEAGGGGWSLLAATQLGADRDDPRLQAAMEVLLESRDLPEGWESGAKAGPWCCLARVVEAAAALGWERHETVGEVLARLAEAGGEEGWTCIEPGHDGFCPVTPVALTAAAAESERLAGHPVLRTAAEVFAAGSLELQAEEPGYPNLLDTDEIELLWTLARSGASPERWMEGSLRRLQSALGADGLVAHTRQGPLPALGSAGGGTVIDGQLWVSLHAAVALSRYAVSLGLPRRFPQKPPDPEG